MKLCDLRQVEMVLDQRCLSPYSNVLSCDQNIGIGFALSGVKSKNILFHQRSLWIVTEIFLEEVIILLTLWLKFATLPWNVHKKWNWKLVNSHVFYRKYCKFPQKELSRKMWIQSTETKGSFSFMWLCWMILKGCWLHHQWIISEWPDITTCKTCWRSSFYLLVTSLFKCIAISFSYLVTQVCLKCHVRCS